MLVTNNDILRRIRTIFDFNDEQMITVFGLADYEVTSEQIRDWLKKDDDPAYQPCSDNQLAIFLNGLINHKRGKKEGTQPEPEQLLSNNIIFMKLKIALNLKADDVLQILSLVDADISKHELNAFFRKTGKQLNRERFAKTIFMGKTMIFPIAPIEPTPPGDVCLDPIGDYTKPIAVKK